MLTMAAHLIPLDKLMEALEANKDLYERLLTSERKKRNFKK